MGSLTRLSGLDGSYMIFGKAAGRVGMEWESYVRVRVRGATAGGGENHWEDEERQLGMRSSGVRSPWNTPKCYRERKP